MLWASINATLVFHDVNLLINDKFESLINETTDDNYVEELNSINLIIKQFPIFKKMEYEYKKLLEEIIVLKEHIHKLEENKVKLNN